MFKGALYSIKQSLIQLVRNRNMCTASIFSITSMLLILGLFFILVVNTNMLSEAARSQIDTIQVYIEDEVETSSVIEMERTINKLSGVNEVTFVDKDEALEKLKVRWGENGYLLEGLEENPLPRAFEIKVNKLEDADAIVARVEVINGVESIKYSKSVVEQLIGITNTIKLAGGILIIALIIISVILVSNTVKLTVVAREREISIMKYVGATNWFIRGPFFIEGIIIGIIGAAISLGIINVIYVKIMEALSSKAIAIFSMGLVPSEFLISNLVWIFIVLGISIGSMGSILSMRRFLDT